MATNNFISIATVITSFLLGTYIIYKDPRNKINLAFAVSTFCVTGWVLVNYLADTAKTPEQALFWARMALATPIIIPLSLLYFSRVFPIQSKPFKRLNWFLISLPTIIILILTPTKLNIGNVSFTDSGQETIVGPLYIPFAIYFIAYIFATFFNLFKSYKTLGGSYKNQIRYLFLGLTGFFVIALLTNAVLPIFGLSSLVSFGPLASLIFLFSVSYAIVKHRLLDIEVIIRRSLVYSILLATLTGLYSILVFGLNRVFLPEGTAAFPRITDIIAIVLVALTVDPLKRIIERSTDKVFFQARYNMEKTLNQISEKIASVIALPQLVAEIKKVLKESVKVSKIAIYAKADHHYALLASTNDFHHHLDISN